MPRIGGRYSMTYLPRGTGAMPKTKMVKGKVALPGIGKTPSGIHGLDEITGGGLPKGRPTLVCGAAGCGKTLLAMEFLVRGAQAGEPGVFVAFEETEDELRQNVASLGFDLARLAAQKKLLVDHVRVERSEIEETGEYDLQGLFIRLEHAVKTIGAKRIVLDTLESLFAGFSNQSILRAELRRLFHWLKQRRLTAVITAERGLGALTRHGLEEYVADCVILLDHRVNEQASTRRLRIVKYRGSAHGADEYPFVIDHDGFSVLPITSLQLHHKVSSARVSTGVPELDAMLSGKGYFRGSSVLISGTAGTGKTSLAAHFAHAACVRGERCLWFAFEESPAQILRNMRSIGLNLAHHVDSGRLLIEAERPSAFGMEAHLTTVRKHVLTFKPHVVVLDPISNFVSIGSMAETRAMLTRIVDLLKSLGITAVMNHLGTGGAGAFEQTNVGISSVIDTWILLRQIEISGERNRGLFVLKSRGMAHSNKIRQFVIGRRGLRLLEPGAGRSGALTSARESGSTARNRRPGRQGHQAKAMRPHAQTVGSRTATRNVGRRTRGRIKEI